MGADLFIQSLYEPNRRKREPLFESCYAARPAESGNSRARAGPD